MSIRDPFDIDSEEIYRRAATERSARRDWEWDRLLGATQILGEPPRRWNRGYRVTPGGRRPLIEWMGRIIG